MQCSFSQLFSLKSNNIIERYCIEINTNFLRRSGAHMFTSSYFLSRFRCATMQAKNVITFSVQTLVLLADLCHHIYTFIAHGNIDNACTSVITRATSLSTIKPVSSSMEMEPRTILLGYDYPLVLCSLATVLTSLSLSPSHQHPITFSVSISSSARPSCSNYLCFCLGMSLNSLRYRRSLRFSLVNNLLTF